MSISQAEQAQSVTFERTMFGEYRLREDAHVKAAINAIITSSVYVISPLVVWGYLMVFEPETMAVIKLYVYIFLGVFMLISVVAGVQMYNRMIAFRMFSTDQQLEIKTQMNTVTIRYTDIVKIERTDQNILLIYTESSKELPVVALSDTITHREFLEGILQQFVPITSRQKLPASYNKALRHLTSFLFLTLFMMHLVSRIGNVVIAAGVATIALCIWTISIQIRFRKEIPIWRGLILILAMVLLVAFRIFMTLQHQPVL